MPALSFQEKVMLTNNYGIVLIRSTDAQGRAFFHYIQAERKAIEQMRRDYEAQKEWIDYTGYGEILYSGWGEPTPDEEAMVKEKWGDKK